MAPLLRCALHKNGPTIIFQQNKEGEFLMSVKSKSRFGAVGRAFDVIGAAIAVSAAVENRRRPSSRDLTTLGIDPQAFDRLG
jgi:hypothetical protein